MPGLAELESLALELGERREKYMKRKTKFDPDRPYGKLTFIKDDLPSPEELAESFRTKKITIDVEEVTLDFFKKKAEYSKSKYQRLMREVLKEYAKKYGT